MGGLKASDKSLRRLEQVSALRTRGLSKDIDLPQLVVCGDQSAGKSSVLEGITNIPFPRDEGVCTKFPTEVILEHVETAKTTITATAIPHAFRSEPSKSALQAFSRSINDIKELPKIISEVGALMGIRGYGQNKLGPAFAEDVLRIKVIGPTGLHISIVDLPGLISVASEVQNQTDIATVHRMVDSYISKPRTIILAVVQASNDIANQSIIRKSKDFDKGGLRSVGIITKPDLINKGTEDRIAALAKNQDTTKLQLGFFLLRNPTPMEMKQQLSPEQRASNERVFFQSSPWSNQNLDPDRIGIEKLRDFLQKLLDQHIENELPKVREEIKTMIHSTEHDIIRLPTERPTTGHLRMYLSDLAMQFHNLSMAALNGDYHTGNSDFFEVKDEKTDSTRLRANVHRLNTEFAADMRDKSKTLKQSKSPSKEPAAPTTNGTPNGQKSTFPTPPVFAHNGSLESSIKQSRFGPKWVTEAEMKVWVRETYAKTRGRELPGNYNHVLLTELFHHQSHHWPRIAGNHLESVHHAIDDFVRNAVAYLKVEDHVRNEIQEIADTKMQEGRDRAQSELDKICADERQQPITYNHYYTDNVQKIRLDSVQELIEEAMNRVDRPELLTPPFLVDKLRDSVVVNMDEQACNEALAGLDAYYSVAMKTFTDNVCRQVIERHLLRSLPEIFSPHIVAGYSDEELLRIAGERQDVVEKRKGLMEQLKNLKAGLNDLRR